MTVPAQAETQVTTATETAKPSFEERIAKSVEANAARLGVATENASAEAQESEESNEVAAEAKSAPTDETESKAKAEEQNESTEARVFTAEELGNPKFFYSLDAKGWSDLEAQHPVLAAGFKSVQSEMTRRERNVKEREKVLAEGEKPKSDAAPAKAVVTVNKAELIDALNDPERVDEAMAMLAELPGFEKAIDRVFEKKGIKPDALREVSATDAFDRGLNLAAEKDPALKRQDVLEEIESGENDETIASMLQSTEPKVVAAGLRWASANALVRLGEKAKANPKAPVEEKPDKLQAAKAAAKKAVALNPKVMTPASTEANRSKTSVRVDDKSIPFEQRIEASAARHEEEIRRSRGSNL